MKKTYWLKVPIRVMDAGKPFPLNFNKCRNANGFKLGKIKKSYARIVKRCIKEQLGEVQKMDKIGLHFEFFFANKRRQDLGNWSSIVRKYFEDVLTEIGVIEDGNYNHVKGDGDDFGGIGEECCIITIREI